MTKLEEIARACLLPVERGIENAEESGIDPYGIADACARAAVEAMREPTAEMQIAGWHETEVWHAMIDAILAEQPE